MSAVAASAATTVVVNGNLKKYLRRTGDEECQGQNGKSICGR